MYKQGNISSALFVYAYGILYPIQICRLAHFFHKSSFLFDTIYVMDKKTISQ